MSAVQVLADGIGVDGLQERVVGAKQRRVAEVVSLRPQEIEGGRDVGREAIHAEDQRSAEAEVVLGAEQQGHQQELRDRAQVVTEYLKRAERAGIRWPLPSEMDNAQLESLLFPPPTQMPSSQRPQPDWVRVHQDLKGKGVTLSLLWEEYKAANPEGFQYSWFCESYAEWASKLDVVMGQEHRAGEKLFVDYAGQTIPVTDRKTGEVREAQLFVAVLGASSYTYSEATWPQGLPDWIGSHVRAFSFFGGLPEVVVSGCQTEIA